MTEEDFIRSILMKPVFKKLEIGQAQENIGNLIPLAINKITNRHEFYFATGESVVDGGTVVDQSDYELPGDNNDARDIINIRYDTSLAVLDKWTDEDMDTLTTWSGAPTSVRAWYRLPDQDNVPYVRIIATPGTASKILKYRYKRKDIGFTAFPEEWQDVLMDSIMSCLGDIAVGPKNEPLLTGFSDKFERSLNRMIISYEVPSGTGQPARHGFTTKNRNIERNRLHGY